MTLAVDTRRSPFTRWRGVDGVSLAGGFWGNRQRVNREVSLGHGFRMLRDAGNVEDLRIAAGQSSAAYKGPVFMDSDLYKWLEAVGYAAAGELDAEVRQAAEDTIQVIQRAQAADGYLNSYYQVVAPERRWQELPTGHELYCAGHLIQAAIAWQRTVGDDRLLAVARRFADNISDVFGPGRRVGVPGHPEIEMALVELYRTTNVRAYLDLAQFFIDNRGFGVLGSRFGGAAYFQDRVPVRDAVTLEGHAVRALYLTAGVTDVYLETGERALLDAVLRQWTDLVAHKLYVTGGAGARHTGEAFGHEYELSNEGAYCETCAAIASIMWSWRLLLATGEARFADLIERTLYNGFLSGVSLVGDTFFYVNPLLSRGETELVGGGVLQRQSWFDCACCPPNVMRLLASLDQYVASYDDEGVQVHQYMAGSIDTPLATLRMETEYPWRGDVIIRVMESKGTDWALKLRIPAWAPSFDLRINGVKVEEMADGYVTVRRDWHNGDRLELVLPMAPRLIEPHPRIDANRGCVAIERGPLVYCLEQADNDDANVLDFAIDIRGPLDDEWRNGLLGGVVAVHARGYAAEDSSWDSATFRSVAAGRKETTGRPVKLTAVPYFAWANRSPGAMRVWVPYAGSL